MVGNAVASRLTPPAVRLGAHEFRLAEASDDAALRELLRDSPLPGWVTLAFEREPSYFAGAGLGAEHQAIIAREIATGAVSGMCALSWWQSFVNGLPRRLAYLGELRLAKAARGNVRMLCSGFEAIRRLLPEPTAAPLYLTSIVEGNLPARRLLTHGLPGFPRYHRLDGFTVAALKSGERRIPGGITVAAAEGRDETAILTLLRREYARFQLAPVWDENAIRAAPGLSLGDFILASSGDRLLGCVALWDQRALRQTRVLAYAGWLSPLRGWVNLAAPLLGLPHLPRPGAALEQIMLSHLAVAEDDPRVFDALIAGALGAARRRGADLAMLGLADTHPLAKRLARAWRGQSYRSTLYLVSWPEAEPNTCEQVALLDDRPFHVELAIL